MQEFYSNGKLLLSGEYVVLDGAKSLALPTVFGQHMGVQKIASREIHWKSIDNQGNVWFTGIAVIPNGEGSFDFNSSSDPETAALLGKLLTETRKLNSSVFDDTSGFEIATRLNFPRDWGLGSSSTLINNIAQWTKVDAYALLWNAFKGSGYDIACAQHSTPISYELIQQQPKIAPVAFNPSFTTSLFFVYRNKKQNSRDGITRYQAQNFNLATALKTISSLTDSLIAATDLDQFEKLLIAHENCISSIIGLPPVKQALFPDYPRALKSLGAWGGDFILAVGGKAEKAYFETKGYSTIISYEDMILATSSPQK